MIHDLSLAPQNHLDGSPQKQILADLVVRKGGASSGKHHPKPSSQWCSSSTGWHLTLAFPTHPNAHQRFF